MAEPELYSNRYEILRHVARGGMAEVYLARDHLLDRPVALKVLFPEYARDEAFVERFRREAKAAAQLNHPNIVAVYDWGEEGGTYFIVMEYVEGQSLRDMIHREGPLLPERAAEITADIAAALGFAHRHGVVHRDVKPGNVLITSHGQVKVTDFGIARGREAGALTRTGMVMGTATYFSPEQAQGLDVDPRSDVYSLGVVLYEMAVGSAPFSGDDPVAIAYQHVREEATPPSVRNPDVPVDLERVILTALAKTPADRYPSAEDMRADLIRFTRGLPVAATPVTAMMAETADATMVGRAATADHTQAVDRTMVGAGPPPTPYEEPSGNRRMAAYIVTLIALLLVVAGLLYLLARSLGIVGGGGSVVVPEVVGMQLDEARQELEDLGLEVDPEFVENAEVPENQVFAQDPEAGEKVDEGDVVVVRVSQGVGSAPVPDVIDREFEAAEEILEDAGFDVRRAAEFSDEVEEGRVIRTSPEAGEEAELGTTVTVVVSSGSEPVEVPNVVGQSAVDAAETLAAAGFDVETTRQPSDSVAEGDVISMNPAAGTQAERGTTVTIVVSSGAA
ncbi:MAG TPA: Stk1 family PASTA domain-containing Ser/Thr kinase, partial [Acidimicrobiia bacterium]|nr:Stk1 family PASTA domain-containing Ser/Thr kinase [Acidimicrobiia bacterium]